MWTLGQDEEEEEDLPEEVGPPEEPGDVVTRRQLKVVVRARRAVRNAYIGAHKEDPQIIQRRNRNLRLLEDEEKAKLQRRRSDEHFMQRQERRRLEAERRRKEKEQQRVLEVPHSWFGLAAFGDADEEDEPFRHLATACGVTPELFEALLRLRFEDHSQEHGHTRKLLQITSPQQFASMLTTQVTPTVLNMVFEPEEGERRPLTSEERLQIMRLYEECRKSSGLPPGAYAPVLWGSELKEIDEAEAFRFRMVCHDVGVQEELEKALAEIGVRTVEDLSRVYTTTEFRGALLGLRFDPNDGNGERHLTDGEQLLVRRLYDECRREGGLPRRRDTKLLDPPEISPADILRERNPKAAFSGTSAEMLHEFALECGVEPALEAVLARLRLDTVDAVAQIFGDAEISSLLRLRAVLDDDGIERPLTEDEKQSLLRLCRRCRAALGMVDLSYSASESARSSARVREKRPSGPSKYPIASDNTSLHSIAERNGVPATLVKVIEQAANISDVGTFASLRVGTEFESTILAIYYNFDDGQGLRRLEQEEKNKLKLLYEACRKTLDLPTGYYSVEASVEGVPAKAKKKVHFSVPPKNLLGPRKKPSFASPLQSYDISDSRRRNMWFCEAKDSRSMYGPFGPYPDQVTSAAARARSR